MTPVPAQPVILLGASNLTLGWSDAVASLRARFGGPLNIRTAIGMGRSYLAWSRFLARRLPGINECGLWETTHSEQPCPAAVLVTDIGNDLVYGFGVDQITSAVAQTIDRCRGLFPDCEIAVTGLPVESIHATTRLRYEMFRRLLFPGLRRSLSDIRQLSHELNEAICELAERKQTAIVHPRRDWYGLDPIHVRQRFRREAFELMFRSWQLPGSLAAPLHAVPQTWPVPIAAHRLVFRRQRVTPQPCFATPEITVSAY